MDLGDKLKALNFLTFALVSAIWFLGFKAQAQSCQARLGSQLLIERIHTKIADSGFQGQEVEVSGSYANDTCRNLGLRLQEMRKYEHQEFTLGASVGAKITANSWFENEVSATNIPFVNPRWANSFGIYWQSSPSVLIGSTFTIRKYDDVTTAWDAVSFEYSMREWMVITPGVSLGHSVFNDVDQARNFASSSLRLKIVDGKGSWIEVMGALGEEPTPFGPDLKIQMVRHQTFGGRLRKAFSGQYFTELSGSQESASQSKFDESILALSVGGYW